MELGLDQPTLCSSIWIYLRQTAPWRSRHVGPDGSARARRHDAGFPGDPRTGDLATSRRGPRRANGRHAATSHQGRWPDHLIRIVGLDRLFHAGVLARPGRRSSFSMPLDWVGGPGRLDVYYEDIVAPVTGMLLIDAALAGDWDVFCNARLATSSCRRRSSAISRSPISPHDPQFHAGAIAPGIHRLTARVKGLSRTRVVWRHALGNVLVPLITVIALSYAYLLEGAVLTETVFAWPGLGRYITYALFNADMNAVLGGTLVVGSVLHRPQPALRHALPSARPEGAMTAIERLTPAGTGVSWLLTECAADRGVQARLGALYLAWLSFRANPLALAGLVIVHRPCC